MYLTGNITILGSKIAERDKTYGQKGCDGTNGMIEMLPVSDRLAVVVCAAHGA